MGVGRGMGMNHCEWEGVSSITYQICQYWSLRKAQNRPNGKDHLAY